MEGSLSTSLLKLQLGSTKEAEEFDNLPPEEAKQRLKILVEKMDLNKDQIIERGELKAWIMRSFK